ncbi:MAG: MBOAT family protein [Erysipelotrichaceae bacterium]|nr:MBOAT family protein [Erysipelotrichaceae bacterium]
MLFPSEVFLFLFLPLLLILYYGIFLHKPRAKNILLVIASLLFYAYGEPVYVFLMLFVILIHYGFGFLICRYHDSSSVKKWLVFFNVAIDLSILGVFKYTDFLLSNINGIFSTSIAMTGIALPIGISFFTFQAISLTVDLSREQDPVRPTFMDVALYISFFPQLIAGPIVRYKTIAHEIRHRKENVHDFSTGVSRFIYGMGKKVLLANQFAVVADAAFNQMGSNSLLMFWLGAVSYTLQIFFDFSGYSDMAIGLGRMFGFHFEENFRYPYISKSVQEFWRRWHISLQTWFRDYVYIPMGGSRVKSKLRLVFNIFVVWLLTGVWHGANWTFICWGIMYGILLLLERFTGFHKKLGGFSRIYTLFFVMAGWVIFRSPNLADAGRYLAGMFGVGCSEAAGPVFWQYLRQYGLWYLAGFVCCTPFLNNMERMFRKNKTFMGAQVAFSVIVFAVSVFFIFSNAYSPFIYFNF